MQKTTKISQPTVKESEWAAIKVIKRDARQTDFDPSRIQEVLGKAFKDSGERITTKNKWVLTQAIAEEAKNMATAHDNTIHVEAIQDIVIRHLFANDYMRTGEAYVVFRRIRERQRKSLELSVDEREKFVESLGVLGGDLQVFQHLSKYSRFMEDKGRRETWAETVDRVIAFLRERAPGLSEDDWGFLRTMLFERKALPSMRTIQMSGPAADRENLCCYNCAFVSITELRDFSDILYILMQGTGVGFSVESTFVEELPKVRKQRNAAPENHTIPDSTEGWCEALRVGMEAWVMGLDIRFDYSQIRPAGAPLKTKGGKASGPEPLKELLDFVREKMLARQGRRLRPIDVHDICCKIGKIVQVGGVRRAAMISLSDLDDVEMRDAKRGTFWATASHRTMANNSAVYERKPDDLEFMREWLALAESGSGERGIFNRGSIKQMLCARRKYRVFGVNPCGEVLLRSRGLCNLTIAVCRVDDTVETLERKVRAATLFGTIQSMLTRFHYVHPDWAANANEERLLGVDLAGAQDCPLLRAENPGRDELLAHLRDYVVRCNEEFAGLLGINPSVATTVVKPGGNSGVFLECGHGVTGWPAPYIKRHVRVNAIDPMSRFLIDQGVPHCPDYDEQDPSNPKVWVFAFPLKAPEGALVMSEVRRDAHGIEHLVSTTSAIDQLENWKAFKLHWTEHNPSITVSVSPDEWLQVGNWVLSNWNIVGGLSFLPRSGRVYQLAPMQEITKEEYDAFVASFPKVDWIKFFRYESGDTTTLAGDFACVGGSCAI